MLRASVLHSAGSPTLGADLLRIKNLQVALKLQLSKMLGRQSAQSDAHFGEREQLGSRAAIQKQIRFPGIPKKARRRTRILRAPSSTQATAIKNMLNNASGSVCEQHGIILFVFFQIYFLLINYQMMRMRVKIARPWMPEL
jgi:uncharacterized membrane protein